MRLGLQTAGFAHAVILNTGAQTISQSLGKAIAEEMPGIVQKLLTQCGGSFDDINMVRVCVGPGGFTSLRSGLAYGQGLSRALNIPLESTSLFHLVTDNDDQLLGFSQGGKDMIVARPTREGFLEEPHLVVEPPMEVFLINEHPGLSPGAFFERPCPMLPPKPLYVRPPDATPAARPPWLS